MKILLLFCLSLVSGGGASKQVTGYPGGGVLIKCKYERGYKSNQKYFCKGPWPKCADQIKTGDKNKWVNTGRFSLHDDTRAAEFRVLIRDLTVEDSGTYQCAVDKELDFDIYTTVELNVLEDLNREKSITVTGQAGGGVNISCKYPESLSSKPKFLCRMEDTGGCNYKTSDKVSRRWIKEEKLSLYNNRVTKTFTVSISDLTEGDSGEYWCGAESDRESDHGYKVYYTQIHLTVTGQKTLPASSSSPQSSKTSTSSASETSGNSSFMENAPPGFSDSSVIIVVSVILVLLLTGLLLLTLTLRKKTQAPAPRQSPVKASNKLKVSLDVCVYEEIKDTTPLPDTDTGVSTVYSTAELPPNLSESSQIIYDNVQLPTSDFTNPIYSSAQIPSNPPGQDVYSTAQLPTSHSDSSARGPQDSAGQSTKGPTYATVNFNKNTGKSSDAVTTATLNEENLCDYATVKYVSGSG